MARHEGVRSPQRDPGVQRLGCARSAVVRSAAGGRADGPVRRFSWAAHVVPARDDPFGGCTGRGRALGGSAVEGTQSPPRLRREHEWLLLPRLQRHQAALRLIRPAFAKPTAIRRNFSEGGTTGPADPLPRDRPVRPRAGMALRSRDPSRGTARDARGAGPGPCRATTSGQPRIRPGASPVKFLCVPCDSPMKLQTVGPPDRGSLSVVYACPECGYEMAMLTNPFETQLDQSLGVRIGPETGGATVAGTSAR